MYGGQLRFIDSRMEAEFYKGNDIHIENNLQIAKAGMGGVAKGGAGKDLTWKTECKKAVLSSSYCLSSLASPFLLPPSWLCRLANTSLLPTHRLYHVVPIILSKPSFLSVLSPLSYPHQFALPTLPSLSASPILPVLS